MTSSSMSSHYRLASIISSLSHQRSKRGRLRLQSLCIASCYFGLRPHRVQAYQHRHQHQASRHLHTHSTLESTFYFSHATRDSGTSGRWTPWTTNHLATRPQLARLTSRVPNQLQGKKTKSSLKLENLPQGPISISLDATTSSAAPEPNQQRQQDDGAAYPTVVSQARRNINKFQNCVLLTRVGGFYELYFEQADEYGPLLNLKVAQKRTNAGPVPMAGFPFFQLDRFLKILVLDLNCHVAVAEEFPNDPGDKVKSGGLMHDRRVTRVITPGTLIDENFIDPYANNYVMAILVNHESGPGVSTGNSSIEKVSTSKPSPEHHDPMIGLAWLDISTGQFYTQSTTVESLPSLLSRVGPREVVVDEVLESHKDHRIFSMLAEDKHLITFAPQGEHLPVSQWSPWLESDIPASTAASFTADEVGAGSLLLQYVKDRLQGLSMKLQPPLRHDNMSIMVIDRNTMRSLEIRQTLRDSAFRGSLLHAIRRTVTKGGARLLDAWLSAPSTSLDTIQSRQDLVEHFIQHEDLRDEIILLLRRSHDSQRLVQKFAFGRGDADDLVALANTIQATEDIVSLLASAMPKQPQKAGRTRDLSSAASFTTSGEGTRIAIQETLLSPAYFTSLISRIRLEEPGGLVTRIRTSIDEAGLILQHQNDENEASQLMTLAENVVALEGAQDDVPGVLPKSINTRKKRPISIRDHYSDDNVTFVMKPGASAGLQDRHIELSTLLEEKVVLGETLRERLDSPSLTLRWTPNLGHICHVKGKDARKPTSGIPGAAVVSSSRSTRALQVSEWTSLGQRIHRVRFEIQSEEQRLFADLRALVVANLVKLRRNAAVLDELDVATSFARLALEQNLTRPTLRDDSSRLVNGKITGTTIIGGRHPTVEGGLREQGRSFTKNDCLVGSSSSEGRLWLITGPNMAGKSTYLRQNALITILAQAGCYVPVDHAELCITDAVFSRVGSADNLYRDQSTFMVEMLETAQILRTATPSSFVIMDEVGRGTTPQDGTAVAFAVLHHLATVNRCRALFATHFHALADVVTERGMHVTAGGPVATYATDVQEDGKGRFIYVHKIRKGVNRQSHALKVARLAGLPETAITVARNMLNRRNDHNRN